MPPLWRPPRVIAHAGGAGLAPENTLAALRASLLAGADVIEVDVRLTVDRVPVLMHDPTVDRTTDSAGLLAELTLEQVKKLDAGARSHEGRFAGERVPTLREALREVRGRAILNLELKEERSEPEIIEVLQAERALRRVWVSSFLRSVPERFRWLAPEVTTALLAREIKEEPGEFIIYVMGALRVTWVGLEARLLTRQPEVVRLAHRRDLPVVVWTVDDEAEVRRFLEAGVDGIVTNVPPVALAVLGSIAPAA